MGSDKRPPAVLNSNLHTKFLIKTKGSVIINKPSLTPFQELQIQTH